MRADAAAQVGSLEATPILDYIATAVQQLVARAHRHAVSQAPVHVLESAHTLIRENTRAVYALAERTPASRTLERGSGSCSQRLAVLESVARSIGVASRVRALHVDRAFWYPRFPRARFAMPYRILLV